jgi:asparagine synthase (glutamine-hydrolysing)
MCGLAGIFSHDREQPVDRELLTRMIATLHHRGPDGSGLYEGGGIGLAFARLAIIDLESGDQPLSNDDGSVWIVFNGEIYNFRELRRELEQRGRSFRTHSDTEVIVRAYEEWGDDCVLRLRGIFAFAIWDVSQQKLLLVRDRTGIKPLHLHFSGNRIVFASEAKAILQDRAISGEIDVVGYLGGAAVSPLLEHTSFANVKQLGAGCMLVARGGRHDIRRYWSYEPALEESD